jgi:peptide/nickel transport system permease protein
VLLALLVSLAPQTRLYRSFFLDEIGQDYVRTARSKGLSRWRVVWHHAARNALLPIVTMAGLQVSSLLGGSVIVETIFGWPGIGRLAFEAVFKRDVPLVMGVLLLLCPKGSRVDVRAQGDDAQDAVTAIGALFASRFGEGK